MVCPEDGERKKMRSRVLRSSGAAYLGAEALSLLIDTPQGGGYLIADIGYRLYTPLPQEMVEPAQVIEH